MEKRRAERRQALLQLPRLKGGVKTALHLSFESALTFGDWDINENWERYKEQFLKGVHHE